MARTSSPTKKAQSGNGNGQNRAFKPAKESGIPSEALRQRIAQKAYEIFQKRGYSHGNDLADWFEAEQQVKKEI